MLGFPFFKRRRCSVSGPRSGRGQAVQRQVYGELSCFSLVSPCFLFAMAWQIIRQIRRNLLLQTDHRSIALDHSPLPQKGVPLRAVKCVRFDW